MTEHAALLDDAAVKAAAKVKRLRAQLENAELELGELETAIRVLGRITGEKLGNPASAQSENGQLIWGFVGVGKDAAKAPKDIIEALKLCDHDLGADLVRTQLWRMAKRGDLKSEGGLYWRPNDPPPIEQQGFLAPKDSSGDWTGVGVARSGFTDDLEDDIPF